MRVFSDAELRSCLHRGFERQRLDGDRAAVHAAQQALAFERDEILADRLARDAERLGDVHGVDAAVAQKPIEDVVLALVGVRGAGVDTVGHDTPPGRPTRRRPRPWRPARAAPRAPASLTSACTSSPKRRRLTAMSPALRDHPPVTTIVRCAPLTAAHRIVDLGRLLGDRFQRRAPQMGGADTVADAEDVESAERRRDDA